MKVINSFIKVSFVLLLLTFCSCQDRVYNKNETEQRIRTMLLTPDSLRSPEDKALFRKLEAIYYEDCSVDNGKFELIINRKEFKAKGVPEICYDMMKKDLDDLNSKLDVMNSHARMALDGFKDSKEEYLARKKSQRNENSK